MILGDYYHRNFNDGPLPVDRIKSNGGHGAILKFSEGLSYGDWAMQQAPRVRGAGLVLGGYHFLVWNEDGAAQADYFLSKYKPQSGDVVPIVDYERGRCDGSSPHPNCSTPAPTARGALMAFIKRIHDKGFGCMVYGHADVKAHFGDFRRTGADHYWCPGDVLHTDAGPPDLWQYSPYTSGPGPTSLAGLPREDVSKVITTLPLIGGDEDMAYAKDFHDGAMRYVNANGPPPSTAPQGVKDGFEVAKGIGDRANAYADAHDATGAGSGASKTHVHGEGVTGPPREP